MRICQCGTQETAGQLFWRNSRLCRECLTKRRTAKLRVCACGAKEAIDAPFYDRSALCRECYSIKRREGIRKRRQITTVREHDNARSRSYRQRPDKRAMIICIDARRIDKRNGHVHDLPLDYVKTAITYPCQYCKATELKMTMDRIDNNKGHVIGNVLPACIRCNYLRRDMPFVAWIRLAPRLRALHKSGLFGDWIGGINNK